MGAMDRIHRVHGFLQETVAPCFEEVAASPKLTEDYAVQIVEGDECGDETLEKLIAVLREGADDDPDRLYGQTLVIEESDALKRRPHYAGRFLISPLVRLMGDDIYASPTVLFQMKFDGKLHKFMHRYDQDVENHRIEDVTRPQILKHVLNSFTFYRLHAFADDCPW
jgi:hypothetical protein